MTEAEIIKGCQDNDRIAQKELFRQYHPDLLGVCVRYCKNKEEAKDIFQDGMIKIYENIKQFRGDSSLFSWMRKIIINTSISHYHNNLKFSRIVSIDDIPEIEIVNNVSPYDNFTKEELMSALQNLPEEFRIVFNLFAIEGFKHNEISKMLGISLNTSKTRYFRAKKKLHYKLKRIFKESVYPSYQKLAIG